MLRSGHWSQWRLTLGAVPVNGYRGTWLNIQATLNSSSVSFSDLLAHFSALVVFWSCRVFSGPFKLWKFLKEKMCKDNKGMCRGWRFFH